MVSIQRPQLTDIRAVIFDWAGTTIDYGSRAPTQVFIEMFRRREVVITEAEAREPMGMAKRAHIAAIARMPRVAQSWQQRYGHVPGESDVDSIYAEFLPMQKSTLADHSQLIPGVTSTVAMLRQRSIKIGSSTGYTRELMEVVVPLAARQGYQPDVIVCSDDVREGRPAPWMNFHAAEQLGVYPMKQVMVVDDTPIGIAAGLAAGAFTVAVAKTGNSLGLSLAQIESLAAEELNERLTAIRQQYYAAGAHYVVDSVADLPSLFVG